MAYVDLRLIVVVSRPSTYTFYYKVPCGRVEDIQPGPQKEDNKKPVARMLQALPDLSKVELGHHQGKDYYAEDEERVLVLLFHYSASFGAVSFCADSFGAGFCACFFGMVKRTFSLSSFFSL